MMWDISFPRMWLLSSRDMLSRSGGNRQTSYQTRILSRLFGGEKVMMRMMIALGRRRRRQGAVRRENLPSSSHAYVAHGEPLSSYFCVSSILYVPKYKMFLLFKYTNSNQGRDMGLPGECSCFLSYCAGWGLYWGLPRYALWHLLCVCETDRLLSDPLPLDQN